MKKVTAFSVLIIVILSNILKAEDFRYWNWTIIGTKVKDVRVSVLLDNRFKDNADDHYFRFASLKLSYPLHPNLTAGVNYSVYQLESKNFQAWKDCRRLEFELNPKYGFENGVKLSLRNRVEFRDIEDKGTSNTRSRHRLKVFIAMDTRFEALQGFSASNEFFVNYDGSQNRWNENRFQPLGLIFKLSEQCQLGIFFMQQMKRKNADWTQTPALGTSMIYKF